MRATEIETVSICATVRMGDDFLLDDLVKLVASLVDAGWAVVEISSRRSGYVFELASPGGGRVAIRYTWEEEGGRTRHYVEVCSEAVGLSDAHAALEAVLKALGAIESNS